jgi:hypothetical protein
VAAVATVAGDAHLTTTYHHPFYDETQSAFVEAEDLEAGDVLQTPTGTAQVTGVRRYHADTTTYGLTIGTLHTYYVLAGTTSVLVQNCDPVNDFGVPNTSGVYTIHLSSGEKYVGMSTTNIQDRVAGSIAPGHAVAAAGYSCADI